MKNWNAGLRNVAVGLPILNAGTGTFPEFSSVQNRKALSQLGLSIKLLYNH
jgi:hypothetical protein